MQTNAETTSVANNWPKSFIFDNIFTMNKKKKAHTNYTSKSIALCFAGANENKTNTFASLVAHK